MIEYYEHISELPIANFFEIKKKKFQYLVKKPFWKITEKEVLPENYEEITKQFNYQLPTITIEKEIVMFNYLKWYFKHLCNPDSYEYFNKYLYFEKEVEKLKKNEEIESVESEQINLDEVITTISITFKIHIKNKYNLSTLDFFNYLKQLKLYINANRDIKN